MGSILTCKEVSDAILAASGIHDNRNCGGQFSFGFDLAQTIRLQLAQLCWRRHWGYDSATLLGAIETQGVATRREPITEFRPMPPHGSKRQLMVPGGPFMSETATSWGPNHLKDSQ